MLARRCGSAWEALAPAKLNFYLEVLGRRPDGFHEVETLMVPIGLYDRLRWTPSQPDDPADLQLAYGPATPRAFAAAAPRDESNLVIRAARALAQAAGVPATGKFLLDKFIPPEAGLGGGSSDAAAALRLANAAWGLDYSTARLAEIGGQLGSDVPFFLFESAAVCRGRGEQVEAIANFPRLDVVVIKPPWGVPTAEAYRRLGAGAAGSTAAAQSGLHVAKLLAAVRAGRLATIGSALTNRLEQSAAAVERGIGELRSLFDRLSCVGRQMTGSGSAYFGLMRSARHARWAAGRLASMNLGTVFATSTRH